MPLPKSIQINIPEPCNQGWEGMTPSGQGRFCGNCQKTVIDFSAWSDAALYEFFAKQKSTVCGRFSSLQMGRPINKQIPPQPQSRLYRMVIAMALTLIFTQGADVCARSRPPLVETIIAEGNNGRNEVDDMKGAIIRGRITEDGNQRPMAGIRIYLYKDGVKVDSAITGTDGRYEICGLKDGVYDIEVQCGLCETTTIYNIKATAGTTIIKDAAVIRFYLGQTGEAIYNSKPFRKK